MSSVNPLTSAPFISASLTTPSGNTSNSSSAPNKLSQDVIELSLAGRIALGVGAGRITSAQAKELTSELNTISQTVQGGGSATNLEQQLSQEIYADGHNGASIPVGTTVTKAEMRDFVQSGRIAYQEHTGNLTGDQATQLFAQMQQIYQQSQNGASATATNQAQNQLSVEIYNLAHDVGSTPISS